MDSVHSPNFPPYHAICLPMGPNGTTGTPHPQAYSSNCHGHNHHTSQHMFILSLLSSCLFKALLFFSTIAKGTVPKKGILTLGGGLSLAYISSFPSFYPIRNNATHVLSVEERHVLCHNLHFFFWECIDANATKGTKDNNKRKHDTFRSLLQCLHCQSTTGSHG